MKKSILIIFSIICCTLSYGQAIEKFLEFRLGQPISEVRNILNNKYPNAKWTENRYELNQKVQLAGETFESCNLFFNNGILTEAILYVGKHNLVETNEEAVRFVENSFSSLSGMADRLYSKFALKYGNETLHSGNSITWKRGNSLTITINHVIQELSFNLFNSSVALNVRYSYLSQNDNY